MIVRLTGILSDLTESTAVLERDGIAREVLLCGSAHTELVAARGRSITLHTLEYYEGSSAGGNLIPRLVGFVHTEDRAFFERFIRVKGMGIRKALKALAEPAGTVAAWIESGDAKALARLPGIGKRAADQIIAELRGKVEEFALTAPAREEASPEAVMTEAQRDALEVMATLGEKRLDAQRWILKAAASNPGDHPPDEWVRLAYRVRSLSEV